jgi:signal recognition particle subunit SEC65
MKLYEVKWQEGQAVETHYCPTREAADAMAQAMKDAGIKKVSVEEVEVPRDAEEMADFLNDLVELAELRSAARDT